MRTGPIVTLEVAKQGAIYHGLATLLSQPSPVMTRGKCKVNTCYSFRYQFNSWSKKGIIEILSGSLSDEYISIDKVRVKKGILFIFITHII